MLWCVTAIVTIFGTPRLALRHHLSIHIERAGPTFSPPPKLARDPCETVKFESCGGASRNLGESLNVCIPARIPLPQIKLTFINIYGGKYVTVGLTTDAMWVWHLSTGGGDRIEFMFFSIIVILFTLCFIEIATIH